jgi:hypothetical protein
MEKRPNEITSANAGQRLGFAGKSGVALSSRPGVAEFIVGHTLTVPVV